jgi:hypothetical protein
VYGRIAPRWSEARARSHQSGSSHTTEQKQKASLKCPRVASISFHFVSDGVGVRVGCGGKKVRQQAATSLYSVKINQI